VAAQAILVLAPLLSAAEAVQDDQIGRGDVRKGQELVERRRGDCQTGQAQGRLGLKAFTFWSTDQ